MVTGQILFTAVILTAAAWHEEATPMTKKDTHINLDRREILLEVMAGVGIMALVGLLEYWFFNTWASKVIM